MKETKHFGYRPLKDVFEVRDSDIEGQGLFAKVVICPHPDNPLSCYVDCDYECIEGQCAPDGGYVKEFITHHLVHRELLRSPIGGFINHDDNPNCTLVRVEQEEDEYTATYYLRPLDVIHIDEEITLNYNVHCMCGKP